MSGFVAVHIGAGHHCTANRPQCLALMKRSCRKGREVLAGGGSATEAVVAAITELENSPLTNAGRGSALTAAGRVECDACVMDGVSLLHGAVGAVSGVVNPALLARKILQEQDTVLTGGLQQPNFLVGQGAYEWAKKHKISIVEPSSLITAESQSCHRKAQRQLRKLRRLERRAGKNKPSNSSPQLFPAANLPNNCRIVFPTEAVPEIARDNNNLLINDHDNLSNGGCKSKINKRASDQSSISDENMDDGDDTNVKCPVHAHGEIRNPTLQHDANCFQGVQDTVGCVVVGVDGSVAAGSSSGGLLLKTPGRVGQAAIPAAGCWAEHDVDESGYNIASCSTGCGEQLVQTQLARATAQYIASLSDPFHPDVPKRFRQLFLESKYLTRCERVRLGGCLSLRHNPRDGSTDLYCHHTTGSMGYAYTALHSNSVKAMFTGVPKGKEGSDITFDFYSHQPIMNTPEDVSDFSRQEISDVSLDTL